jgi:hypothetical protein
MTDTTHLGLPFIDGSQAQKHVTHNEALRILDAAIQIGVEDTTLATPPETPAAGSRYLVPDGASGAWSGQAHAIACWEDGAWRFLVPKMGWCIWSAADEMQLVFDGTEWRNMPGGEGTLGAITELGVNATPDGDNRLSVCSNAALFSAIDVADDGTGDMRIQISKEEADNVASVVFSDAFSGRAEFGLIGSDAFKLKVSDDGTSFTEAFTIDQATGNLTLPRGLALSGVVSPATITTDQDDYDPAGLSTCSVLQLSSDVARAVSGLAGGIEGRVLVVLNIGSETITLRDDGASSVAANRFAFGGDIALGPKHAAVLRYDGTAARWFAIARSGGAGGGGSGSVTSVTAGAGLSGGTITTTGTIALADDIRRNILLDRIYQSKLFGAPRRVVNAWATGFKAATDADRGINTGSSSNVDASNAAAGGYVAPALSAQRISGGTPATLAGTAANINDDNIATAIAWTGTDLSAAAINSRILAKIDYGSNKTISKIEAKQYFQSVGGNSATGLYYSTDGTTWTQLGSNLTVGTTPTNFNVTGSVTARYIAIVLAQANYTSATVYLADLSGYAAAPGGLTLVTASQTTETSVSNARVLLEFDNTATPTLNTDLAVEVTCNGGANWSAATLSAATFYSQGGRGVAETADTTCTVGTSFAARIKTESGKNVPIYGVSVAVR